MRDASPQKGQVATRTIASVKFGGEVNGRLDTGQN
jgi:hypothetical protein